MTTKRRFTFHLLLLALAAALNSRAAEEAYRDNYVVAYIERRSSLLGNVHGDETVILRVFGATYRDVRGSKPYYIRIPELNSIIFVSDHGEDDARLHVVNLETKKEVSVRLSASNFGSSIGYESFGRKRGDPFSDYVEKADGNVLELHSVGTGWEEITKIDIGSALVKRRETVYRDKSGRVTKRFIDGKRVEQRR